MKKFTIILLLITIIVFSICGPVSTVPPTQFLNEEVLIEFLHEDVVVMFDTDLPSGRRFIVGKILSRNDDWIIVTSQNNRVYLCNIEHIVCIETQTAKQQGENEVD